MGARNHPALIRRRTARLMRAERLARAVAPAAGILFFYVVLALFGLGNPLVFAAFLLLGAAALAFGMVRCRWPLAAEIDRRIEAASSLPHRPLATLDDQLEAENPLTRALWLAHRRRAALALGGARAGWAAPQAGTQDPWALRALLLLLLLTAVVSAGQDAPGRIAGAFALPAWPFKGPQLDIWITPPDYAAAPPRLLGPGAAVTTLRGSRITVVINGPRRLPWLQLDHAPLHGTALSEASYRADAVVTASGRLLIGAWWHRLGSWRIDVEAPATPQLRLRTLSVAIDGRLWLAWHIDDPYGIARLTAQVAPIGFSQALPQIRALPFASGDASTLLDLRDDPLAGLPSRLILTAVNRAGMAATLAPDLAFTPPAPALNDPTSNLLFKLRQHLALQPDQAPAVAVALGRVAAAPPSAISDRADVQLAGLAGALTWRLATPTEAVRRLGLLIREIEAGPGYQTAQALAQANAALTRALQKGLAGAPETAAALQKLLQAMHDALANHLAAQPPTKATNGKPFDLSALDRLARKIAADEAAGRTQQAAQELQALRAALNALQSAQPMTAAAAARAQAATAGAAALANLTTGEAALRDDTHRGIAQPRQQGALQSNLKAAQGELSQAGLPQPALGAAAQAMAAAQGALSRADGPAAEAAESKAIMALQKAAAALQAAAGRALSVEAGSGTLPGGPEGANGAPDEDPSGFILPSANPADAVQQRIIREDATPGLPAPTHQYLHRLLLPDSR